MAGSIQNSQAKPSNSTPRPHHTGNPQGTANVAENGTPSAPVDVASSGVKNGATTNGTDNGNHHLLHDVGLSLVWSSAEQSSLEEGLVKYAGLTNNLAKYIKLAALLPEKTVRDVALRCIWITKKENGKRRKVEEQNASKKSKDKKQEKLEAPTRPVAAVAPRVPMPMYTPPPPPVDNDDGISNDAIGGPTGRLLEHNTQVIAQIRANLAACKLQENTELLVQFRDNIFAILNGMTIMPGIMSQMPPLPVNLNSELADRILPMPMPQSSAPLHQ
ncbi:hypothetical protein BDL97_01G091000 [Sphagnum fallax]|nr:hypothetical protein BDL97_01G091000 [Sphagnum fallax]KAH8974234.1 hypothetical protein BDL97_01G091000 [Sphagnum fallax]